MPRGAAGPFEAQTICRPAHLAPRAGRSSPGQYRRLRRPHPIDSAAHRFPPPAIQGLTAFPVAEGAASVPTMPSGRCFQPGGCPGLQTAAPWPIIDVLMGDRSFRGSNPAAPSAPGAPYRQIFTRPVSMLAPTVFERQRSAPFPTAGFKIEAPNLYPALRFLKSCTGVVQTGGTTKKGLRPITVTP